MKAIKSISALLLASMLAVGLISCKSDDEEESSKNEKTEFSLSFDVSGLANKVSSLSVKSTDEALTEEYLNGLVTGVKDGYKFKGWYKDSSYTTSVTYPFKVSSDIRLYAKFVKVTTNADGTSTESEDKIYKISYVTENGSRSDNTVADSTVLLYENLSTIRLDNYFLEGWYYDSSYTKEAYAGDDFTKYLDSNNTVKLYAKWIKMSDIHQNLAANANFVGLTFDDLKNVPLYARTGKTDAGNTYKKISTLNELTTKGYDDYSKYRAYMGGCTKTAGNVLLYGETADKFFFEFGTKKTPEDSTKCIAFNGTALPTLPAENETVSIKDIRAFVAIRAPEEGSVTATFKNMTSSSNADDSKATAGFLDESGKVLKTLAVNNKSGASTETYTLTYDVNEAKTIFFTYGRNGDNAGGVKLTSIKFTKKQDSATPTVTLPESVGTNPFAGKTFPNTNDERKVTWSFTDDVATYKQENLQRGREFTYTYRYTYDATEKLIFLAMQSYSFKDDEGEVSYSSVSEFEKLAREEFGDEITEEELEIELASAANEFATMTVYQYEISDSSISFTDYFYGTLPTTVRFRTSDRKIMLGDGEGIWLFPEGSSGNGDGYHCEAPTFKDGKFSGKLSFKQSDDWKVIGTIEGSYTTSGKGTSGCTITLTFTKLPDSVTGFTTGTQYVLTN